MTINTARLTLRPLRLLDLGALHVYESDRRNTVYLDGIMPKKRHSLKRVLRAAAQWKMSKKRQLRYEFAVMLDGVHMGTVKVLLSKHYRHKGELAWVIARAHHGKGYATEAARAVMNFARRELGVRIFHAKCDHRNVASMRVMEKIGLQPVANELMPATWNPQMRYFQLIVN
ncbi:MAG: GNAT family N-acetyltransferase [Oscillospiraceae bacterium]|nr:GNAT family N-acetyltransferase [Oscillospiraceae bacterium]